MGCSVFRARGIIPHPTLDRAHSLSIDELWRIAIQLLYAQKENSKIFS
jgi:hypothetical protein